MSRLSRKEKRLLDHGNFDVGDALKDKICKIKTIKPITENQATTFDAWARGKNLLLTGTAGTGKSFISLYLALTEVFKKPTVHEKVTIVRSVVPTRDMGFMPGNNKEKSRVYEAPYYSIFDDMSMDKNAYEDLKHRGFVEFMTTSFARGMNIRNTIMVIDEIQNMTGEELHTMITRAGRNCRIIMCGDLRQNDLVNTRQKSGFTDFVKILDEMKSFEHVIFNRDDIVRSNLVKDYIITREDLEDRKEISLNVV